MTAVPVLRELTPFGRIVVLATIAATVAAIVIAYGLGIHGSPVFIASSVAILGLAFVIGLATERLGALTGPQVGGILNATFGNVAELIIAFFALKAGLIEVVKASITGSIIGNLLLVLGLSLLFGGLRNGTLLHNARVAALDATLLLLAVIGLFIPAVFAATEAPETAAGPGHLQENVVVSVILVSLYFLALFYRFRHPSHALENQGDRDEHAGPPWTRRTAIAVLGVTAVLLAVLSEMLVGAIDPFIDAFHLTPVFVGVVLIPAIGNLAEHLVAVQLAVKNRIDFAMAVAVGSSLQVALFVAPALVFAGVLMRQPMDLVFAPLEMAGVAVAAAITVLVSLDGESNWLEGALLFGVYLILAVSFFFFR